MNRAAIFHRLKHLELRLLERKFSRLLPRFLDNISITEPLCSTPLLDIRRIVKYIAISRVLSLGCGCWLFDRKWEISRLLHKDLCILHILRSDFSGTLKQELHSLTFSHFHNFIASICKASITCSIATSHQNTTAFTLWNQVSNASSFSNSMNFISIVENEQPFQFVLVRVGNRPGRVGQSLLADPIPIFSGSGHLMPDPVPTLVGIISGSTRSRTHLGEVLADPDRDLDRVAEFNLRYLT